MRYRVLREMPSERAVLNPPKLTTALREMHPQASSQFKDGYLLEFLARLPALDGIKKEG